jgi:aspartyl-tRNA(Asn)/glutamyl-tRNA(Gln) amidotransferase subunit A
MQYAEAMAWMQIWKWRIRKLFEQVDIVVHPTTPTVAPTLADCSATTTVTRRLAKFLYPWSLAQAPVLSIPTGFAEHDMPCGLSIAAPWWREDLLFKAGEAFQRVTDWHLKRPRLLAGESVKGWNASG